MAMLGIHVTINVVDSSIVTVRGSLALGLEQRLV